MKPDRLVLLDAVTGYHEPHHLAPLLAPDCGVPLILCISMAILFPETPPLHVRLTPVLLTSSMAFGAVLAAMGAAAGVGSAFATYFLPVTAIIGRVVLTVYLPKRAWEKVKLVFQGITGGCRRSWRVFAGAFARIRAIVEPGTVLRMPSVEHVQMGLVG